MNHITTAATTQASTEEDAIYTAAVAGLDRMITYTAQAILKGSPWATSTPSRRLTSCILLRDAIADYEAVTGGERHIEDELFASLSRAGVDEAPEGDECDGAVWTYPAGLETEVAAIAACSTAREAVAYAPLALACEWG